MNVIIQPKTLMKTIKINGKDYKIKYTIRALFLFESMTGKTFEIQTLLDSYVFIYAVILANNPDNVLDWDEFISALDEDATLFAQLNALIDETSKIDNLLADTDTDGQKKS